MVHLRTSPLIVVLTGNIGSGKSMVARWLSREGYSVLEADRMVQTLLAEPEIRKTLVTHLTLGGPDQMGFDSFKAAIRDHMVHDEGFRTWYLPFIHQKVRERMKEQLASIQHPKGGRVFLEIPVYFETQARLEFVDEVWLVWTPPRLRLTRWKKRREATYEDLKKLEDLQIPDAKKLRNVDIILLNTTDERGIFEQLKRSLGS
jgi:dephospho-CoA kinase